MNASQDDTPDRHWEQRRASMVAQLRAYKIRDRRILEAMGKIRRHVFVPEPYRRRSDPYGDHPCPIGHGQTISQPFIVAHMTERLNLAPGEKVLELGTGSGYQAALLAELGAEVITVEIVPELAAHARRALASEGYGHVRVVQSDGCHGFREAAPFDAMIGACAPAALPPDLERQLRDGGRMILPVGTTVQRLIFLRKAHGRVLRDDDLMVRFVPMVGEQDHPTRQDSGSPA